MPTYTNIKKLEEEKLLLQEEIELLRSQVEAINGDLRESELRFSQLYEATLEGITIYIDNKIVLFNKAMCNLFGYTEAELIDSYIESLFHAKSFHEAMQQLGQKNTEAFECSCVRKNGKVFPALVHGKFVLHKGVEAKVLVFKDLTRSKEVEQELNQSEQLYQKLFEESRDAIYISGVDGELLQVNDATIQLFGYAPDEIPNLKAWDLYASVEDRLGFMRAMEVFGSVSNYEVKLIKRDGTIMDCLLSSSTRRNANQEVIGYQGIIRDITERNRNRELVKAKEVAEQSASLKARFLANMSHEIRTPMNAVVGMTNLLLTTEIDPEQEKYVKGIQAASEHLLVLINDILDFSKIEAGKLQLDMVDFNLQELLENVLETFKFKAKEKNLTLKLVMMEDTHALPPILVGDPTRITQIVINLVSNAIKFTNEGSIEVKVGLFAEDIKNATLSITVSDTGIGIPEEKLEHIFHSFEQVSQNTTRLFGGTGLGLAITKKLVQIHGGSISVRSEIGKGSSFVCSIKVGKGHGRTKSSAFIRPDKGLAQLDNIRILLVEDNELNQVVAVETIKKWGKDIQINVANHGREAIDILSKDPDYDLVLMDVQMPEMNGYDATRHIRKVLKLTQLPILAMTAYATTGEAEKTIMSGMNDYISKPFDPVKLHRKISKLALQNGQPNEQTQASNDIEPETPTSAPDHITNFSFLNEATSNDNSLKIKMLEIMLRETPDEIALMEQYCNDQNWERLGKIAHKFKSTITYLGLNNIKEVCKTIQFNAEHKTDLQLLPAMVEQVKNIAQLACNEIKAELAKLY
ncbi:MAG: PAS domain S-box protein [Sphingobacteriales bacterium]|nr:PAS domain S-box protein [Sphingobacteriales bacterium]